MFEIDKQQINMNNKINMNNNKIYILFYKV